MYFPYITTEANTVGWCLITTLMMIMQTKVSAINECDTGVKCANQCLKEWTGSNAASTCYSNVECQGPEYLDVDCACTQSASSCFQNAWSAAKCKAVSNNTLLKFFEKSDAKFKCEESDVSSILLSTEWCHVSNHRERPPGRCANNPALATIFAVLLDGKIVPIRNPQIRTVHTGRLTDSIRTIGVNCEHNSSAHPVICHMQPGRGSCNRSPEMASCYEFYDSTNEFYVLDLNTCWLPITCYGSVQVFLYPFQSVKEDADCSRCWIHCGVDEIVVHLDSDNYHMVEICMNTKCVKKLVDSKTISFDRTFRDKVSDSRVQANIYGMKSQVFEKDGACRKIPTCEAIQCFVCWESMMNAQCWGLIMWMTIIFGLWLIVVIVGTLLVDLKRVRKVIIFFGRGFAWVARIIFHLYCAVRRKAQSKLKKTLETVADSSLEYDISFEDVRVDRTISLKETIKSQAANAKVSLGRSKAKSDLSFLMISMLVLIMISPSFTEVNNCLHYQSVSYKTEECTANNDGVHCKGGLSLSVPIYGRGVTSCTEFRSGDGRLVGVLKITPTFVGLRCNKELIYQTVEHHMTFISEHFCPHSKKCSGHWCEDVDDKTDLSKILGIDLNIGPGKQFCVRSQACAGAGCFYCTQSCIVLRWQATRLDSQWWKVYRCPSWVPNANVYIEWKDGTSSLTATQGWVNGRTITIFGKFRVMPRIEVFEKIPFLNKEIVTDGSTAFLAETSIPGQPIAGKIGQVQCQDDRQAFRECLVAANACVCVPSDVSRVCQCTEVSLKAAASRNTILPQETPVGTVKMQRDNIILEVSANGQMSLEVTTLGDMKAISTPPSNCSIELRSLKGCYSCLQGAILEYNCRSNGEQSSYLTCNLGNTPIGCGANTISRTTVIALSSPVVDLTCVAACDGQREEKSISGSLEYHGFDKINAEDVLHIIPNSTVGGASWNWTGLASIGSFFKGLFSSISWFKILIIAMVGIIVLVLCIYFFKVLTLPLTLFKKKKI